MSDDESATETGDDDDEPSLVRMDASDDPEYVPKRKRSEPSTDEDEDTDDEIRRIKAAKAKKPAPPSKSAVAPVAPHQQPPLNAAVVVSQGDVTPPLDDPYNCDTEEDEPTVAQQQSMPKQALVIKKSPTQSGSRLPKLYLVSA